MTAGFVGVAGADRRARGRVPPRLRARCGNPGRSQPKQRRVIESTGGIAGVTAEHVDQLGDSLLHLSGVDDELIKSSQNLLLTFTNVRNVVGEGNDIFDQATLAALNLSTRDGHRPSGRHPPGRESVAGSGARDDRATPRRCPAHRGAAETDQDGWSSRAG